MRRLRHGSTSWPRASYTMRPEPTPSGQEQRLVYTSSCRRHQRLDAVGEDEIATYLVDDFEVGHAGHYRVGVGTHDYL
jgi:hypothetical protein